MAHLGFEEKLLLWFRNSGQWVTVDSEKEQVWQSAYEFIVQHITKIEKCQRDCASSIS